MIDELWKQIAPWVAIVISLISIGVSLYMYYGKLRYDKDKELMNLASQSLKNAYEVLSGGAEDIPPKPVRMNWLASARSIEQYKELERRIKTQIYTESCLIMSEIWRLKFYKALDILNVKSLSAYQMTEYPNGGGALHCLSPIGLEPRSIAVLYDFAINGMDEDFIDKVDLKALVEKGKIFSGNNGLQMYFDQSDEYAAIIARQGE
ncbi:hypothetical protein ACQ0P8_06795 [Halodesulfovibrio aestuarii]|uniref:Uncharacterized protein n=1 Tax=Halodesulfovibrio aestuarii TaxID=126333 RepID=A0A8G2FAA4_9BACT|nr:hypothetical protein [Halodesulfovibrio aestuarii]SHJ76723.1 hypothetical protein SAMN05660830_03174 [Halodesulfovibrio aestuarii]